VRPISHDSGDLLCSFFRSMFTTILRFFFHIAIVANAGMGEDDRPNAGLVVDEETDNSILRAASHSSNSYAHSSAQSPLAELMQLYNLIDRMIGFMLTLNKNNWTAISSGWIPWWGRKLVPNIIRRPNT